MSQPYEKSSLKLSRKQIVVNNFVGGLFWALGATVGLAFIFALLSLIAKNVNLVPFVGSFVSQVINFVISHNPNLQK
ncbi:MAG TPA: DUF5665 domain-containing protein [Candidatus Saccharimonadales bacterium]|nr:DUF5665 domain-containing protein [Candidatus Saccharimonadales bacterium]